MVLTVIAYFEGINIIQSHTHDIPHLLIENVNIQKRYTQSFQKIE